MPLTTWNRKDSVGVKELDKQHEGLIHFPDRLHAASMRSEAREVAGPVLPRFPKLAARHFSTKQRLIESIRFPGVAEHRLKHREMAERLSEIASCHEKGDAAVFVQLLSFTRNVLVQHIQEETESSRDG
jgi:hemerythrin